MRLRELLTPKNMLVFCLVILSLQYLNCYKTHTNKDRLFFQIPFQNKNITVFPDVAGKLVRILREGRRDRNTVYSEREIL